MSEPKILKAERKREREKTLKMKSVSWYAW